MNVPSGHAAVVEALRIAPALPADGTVFTRAHDGLCMMIAAAYPKARALELASRCRRPSPLTAACP